jgi:hypothetical protein
MPAIKRYQFGLYMVQTGRSPVRGPMRLINFLNFPFLPAALGPGVQSVPNINEYLKQKNNVSGE